MLALLWVPWISIAQETILNRKVTVVYHERTLKSVLDEIRNTYGVRISYSSSVVPVDKKITARFEEKPLRDAITEILKGTDIMFVEIGNQIVLKKGQVKAPAPKHNSSRSIKSSGPVYASSTPTVPVEEEEPVFIVVNEAPEVDESKDIQQEYLTEQENIYNQYFAYQDTARLETGKALKKDLKLALKLLKEKFNQLSDSLNLNLPIRKDSLVTEESEIVSAYELNDTLSSDKEYVRPGQVSFIYPLGMNGVESFKYTNNISLNILAGISGGLNGIEVAGLVNVEKDEVKGVQIAGLVNAVGGPVRGVQVAGLTNVASEAVLGGQGSGLISYAGDSSKVIQASGLVSVVKGSNFGAQFSGLINATTGSMVGPQAAGLINFVPGSMKGVQAAGLLNVTTGLNDGVQVAGLINAASILSGVQISFLNLAGKVRGSQFGFLNIADSVSGVQIGFLSISRKGYRRFELSGNESIYANALFKTGTSRFYNILALGLRPEKNTWMWSYGYGVGTELPLGKKSVFNIDLVCNQVNRITEGTRYLNLVNNLKLQAGYKLGEKTTIFAGPTFNVQVMNAPERELGNYEVAPYTFYSYTGNDRYNENEGEVIQTRVNMWAGVNAGIRF